MLGAAYKFIAAFCDNFADFGGLKRRFCPKLGAIFLEVDVREAVGHRIEGVFNALLAVGAGHTVYVDGEFMLVVCLVRVRGLDFDGRVTAAAAAAAKPFHGTLYRGDRDDDKNHNNYSICHLDHFLENIRLAVANSISL